MTPAATRLHVSPPRSAVATVAVCLAIAVVSLAVPAALSYDTWAWLTWGREVVARSLDTTAGPSWKPLPVVVTTVLSAFGGAAPALWLVLTRTAGLLALVAAYRVAARFAGPVAGMVAAILLCVSPDGDPRYLRLMLEGHIAPLSAALTLWAVECHLAQRRTAAFLLGVVLALDRPEAWPFLLGYGAWLWYRDPRHRWLVATGCALVPVLWFGGDWWGAGTPLHGAGAAQVSANDDGRVVDALVRVADVVAAPGWLLAVVAVMDGRRRGERALVGMAALAAGWFLLVVVMSAALGYAALSRFLLPGAALVCVLAGIGSVRLWEWLTARWSRALAATAVVVLLLPFVLIRVVGVGSVVSEVVDRDRVVEGLDAAIAAGGWARIRCALRAHRDRRPRRREAGARLEARRADSRRAAPRWPRRGHVPRYPAPRRRTATTAAASGDRDGRGPDLGMGRRGPGVRPGDAVTPGGGRIAT